MRERDRDREKGEIERIDKIWFWGGWNRKNLFNGTQRLPCDYFTIIHRDELKLIACAGGTRLEIQTIYFQNNLQMRKSKIFEKINQNIVHKITTLPYFSVGIPLHSKGIIKMPSGS